MHCIIHASSNSHRISSKILSVRHVKPPYKLLIMGIQETPKTMDAIAIVLHYLSELEVKSLLLMVPYDFDRELGEIELVLTDLRTCCHSTGRHL